MKIRLLRDSRIMHKAGETVEVSPAEAAFLMSVQSAVRVDGDAPEQPEEAKKQPRKAKK